MAVLGRLQLSSAERLDLPDLLSIDSYTAADFKYLIQTFVGGTTPYIFKGFDVIQPQDSIATESLSIRIADSVVYFPSSGSGSFFVGLEEGNINALPLIPELRKNATNFVYATFTTGDTAQDSRAFWDPDQNGGEGGEFSQDINTENVLTVEIGTSVSSFPENSIPICKVVVGPAVIDSIEDNRNMMFRLGTGGLNPDPFNAYDFREDPTSAYARLEPPGTMTNAAQPNPFEGGDKNIQSLKEWMDVVMTRIVEISGQTFWYEGGTATLGSLFIDSLGSTLHCKGDWEHDNTVAGRVTWSEDIKYNTLIDPRQIIFRAGTLDLTTNDTVAYFPLIRDADINGTNTPVDWINGSTTVNGPIGAFDNVSQGDWIKQKIDNLVLYLRVEELYTLPNLAGATTIGTLAQSIKLSAGYGGTSGTFLSTFTKGEYLQTDAVISSRDDAALTAVGGDFYWFAHRYDTVLSQGSVVRTDLSLALTDADGERLTCTQAGHGLVDNDRITIAVGSWTGTYQVEVEDANIFYIFTTIIAPDEAAVAAHYAIVTTDATATTDGYSLESAEHGFETNQRIVLADTLSAYDGGYLCSVRTDTTVQIPVPSALVVPAVSTGTVELPRVNVRVSFGFAKVVQGEQINIGDPETSNILDFIGMNSLAETSPTYNTPNNYNALNGHSNYNTLESDNLTDRAAKLTAMMADRVQDRGMELIGEVNITHETNAAFQDITASGTLTIKKPSSPDQVLTLTASLPANSVAVATIDRDGGTAVGLTVESLDTAYALGENKIIVFYRFGTTDIYTWDSERISNNAHFNTGIAEYSGNRNVTVFNPTNAILNNTSGLITLDTTPCPEITDIVCQDAIGAGLNAATGLYWTMNSALDATSYYVWYRVTDGIPPGDPTPGGTGIMVDILLADTASDVATKTAATIDLLPDFNAIASSAYVTVTNAATGLTTDSAAGTSGFTVNKVADGTDSDIDIVIHGSADHNTVDVGVINGLGTLIVAAESAVWIRVDRDANKIYNQILTADAPASVDTTIAGALFITPITDVPIDQDVFVLYMRRGDSLMELHKAVHPDENVYEEFLDVVAGAPANDNEIIGPLAVGSTIFLPADSRNMDFMQKYIVGAGHINLELNGQILQQGEDWSELGTAGCESNKVQIDQPLIIGDTLGFRIDGRGSVYFASPGGTNATMQDIYDNGRFITTVTGQPFVITGPAAEKLVSIQGDLEVTGVIDPTGLEFTAVATDPLSGPGLYVDTTFGDLIWNQLTAMQVNSVKVGVGLTELTQTILDRLVTLQNGSDTANTLHHHDGRYYTETESDTLFATLLGPQTMTNTTFADMIYATQIDAATSGASAAMTAGTAVVRQITNGALTSISTLAGGASGHLFIFENKTGVAFDILNNTGAGGFLTGSGNDITLEPDASLHVIYDSTSSRWRVVGGSGGGALTEEATVGSLSVTSWDPAAMTGTNNTMYGVNAGIAVTSGGSNVCIGALSAATLTTGGSNIFIGVNADASDFAVSNGVAIGTGATTGDRGLSIGDNAGGNQIAGADDNTFLGRQAGFIITTGDNNVCIGGSANLSAATDVNSVVVGTGGNAAANGVAVGYQSKTIGNTAVSVGGLAESSTSGVSIGYGAGNSIAAGGIRNVFLGYFAGVSTTTGDSNVFIGYSAGQNAGATDSDRLIIENTTDAVTPLIDGTFGTAGGTRPEFLQINGRFQTTWTTISAGGTTTQPGDKIKAKTAGGAFGITLHAGADGDEVTFADADSNFETNAVTLTPNGAETILGAATLVLDVTDQPVMLVYDSATTNWIFGGI